MQKCSSLLLLLNLLFLMAQGCVGTINKAEPDATESVQYNKGSLLFAGVHEIKVISNSAIEVYFYQAQGGSGEFTYLINLGDNPIPVSVPYDNLFIDYRGLVKKTVRNLATGTNYLVSISVFDQVTRSTTIGPKQLSAKTFSHKVALFEGIKAVDNLQGVEGFDGLKVAWKHGYKDYSQFFTRPENPDYYEIIALDNTNKGLLPNNVDNKNLTPAQGRHVFYVPFDDATVPEFIIRGLPSNTLFYVFVRCIHLGSINDPTNNSLRSELNNDYIVKRTLKDDLPVFNQESIVLDSFKTLTGENATSIGWDPIIGVFDHIRVYYKLGQNQFSGGESHITSSCSNQLLPSGIICKKLGFSDLSTTIANLERETVYSYQVVVCSSNDCAAGKRITSSNFNLSTVDALAGFSGLTSVRSARTLGEVGSVFINYQLPNLEMGNIDGIGVKIFIRELPTDDLPTSYADPKWEDQEDLENYTIPYFDFKNAGILEIKGFDYSDKTREYCFTLYGKYIINGTLTKINTGIHQCLRLTINTPSKNQFTGLSDANSSGTSRNISLLWSTPSTGIYSDFLVILKLDGTTSFNFNDAIDEIESGDYSNYVPYNAFSYQNNLTISNLNNNQTYKVGILTKFIDDNEGELQYVYSELNSRIFSCTIPNSGVAQCQLGTQ